MDNLPFLSPEFTERLTTRSKNVLNKARFYAVSSPEKQISVVYMLAAICQEHGSLGAKILKDAQLNITIKNGEGVRAGQKF